MRYSNFTVAYAATKTQFQESSHTVHPDRWQAMDVKDRPDFLSFELLNYGMTVPLPTEDLQHYREDVKPNLPWADDHFMERVCGMPINPGKEWANWPWGKSAAKHRNPDAQFNHKYMERYWPKFAGYTANGELPAIDSDKPMPPRQGIRYEYGDLDDVIDLLNRDPLTRQAYLPMFFPEDTGWGDGGRKPCTLGYQFILRNNQLHIYYPMRSCDFIRHYQDDIYLAIRLLLWVLDELRIKNPDYWNDVKPGTYTMHCTSLHIFYNDWIKLFGEKPKFNLEGLL